MTPLARSVDSYLNRLAEDALRQLDGVPAADLNDWVPRDGLADINTFFALATHLVGAGEYWVLHAAGGQPLHRDRPAEFRARGEPAELRARYARWLAACRTVLERLADEDLGRVADLPDRAGQWTIADCIVHAVEHTAVHVGHLQIQRQLWNAEHGGGGTTDGGR